jgi:serine protease Do
MALPNGTFSVLLGTGEKRTASVKGVDRQSNVALFEVEGPPLPPLRQASPQSIAIGSWVAVIANVNVTRPQITLGRVVGRGERIDFPYSGDIVEIEAATYPGASGGAVLNEMGEWVAIVVGRAGKASPAPLGPIAAVPQGAEHPPEPTDLLVALPVDQLQRIADDLESYGSVRRAFLGIQMRRGVAADSLGVLVEGIVTDSPAARAGIQAGDRILAFEGSVIHSGDEITSLVRSLKPDDEVELTLARGTEILPMHATLAGIVGTAPAPPPPSGTADVGKLKRELRRLQEETRRLEQQIKAIEAAPAR